jgi:hypothetical protein
LRLHVHESGYEEHMEHEAVAPQKKRMRNNKVLILLITVISLPVNHNSSWIIKMGTVDI